MHLSWSRVNYAILLFVYFVVTFYLVALNSTLSLNNGIVTFKTMHQQVVSGPWILSNSMSQP